jgi:GAF domain-containing protein/HAMP domain-containing protein
MNKMIGRDNFPVNNEAQKTFQDNRGYRISLGIKLPLIVILLLILSFLISTILSIRETQSTLIETIQNNLTTQADSKAELIRSNLIWTRNVAIDLAAASEVTDYDEDEILSIIENTLARNSQVFGSTIAYEPYKFQPDVYYWSPYFSRNPEGGLRFTQLGNPEYNYFDWEWYTLPIAKGEPVLSPPYFDEGGGEIWMVTWSAPFFDNKTADIKGVATADIAFSQTQEIVSGITVGENGYAFLLDPQGVILGIGENGGEYQVMVDSMLTTSNTSDQQEWFNLVSLMTAGDTGFIEAIDPNGQAMLVAYTPVGLDTGWSLGLAFPQSELFETVSELRDSLIIYSALVVMVFGTILYLFTLTVTRPLRRLTAFVSQLSPENLKTSQNQLLFTPADIKTRDELEDLGLAFQRMTSNLVTSFETLEERIRERTEALESRMTQLRNSTLTARSIAEIQNVSELIENTTKLITEKFGYYHTGLFIIDNQKKIAFLQAASSATGKLLIGQGFRIEPDRKNPLASVVEQNRAIISLDIDQKNFVADENFPLTRSRMILPLAVHGAVIGLLDLHSDQPRAFNMEDVEILQSLTDLIAIAFDNVRLINETQNLVSQLEANTSIQTQRTWRKLTSRQMPAYQYTPAGVRPIFNPEKRSTDDVDNKNSLLVPLILYGQTIGNIKLKRKRNSPDWTEREKSLVEKIADQVSLALENSRLVEEAQKSAVRDQMIAHISTRIRETLDIDSVARTAASELLRVFDLKEAEILIGAPQRISTKKGTGSLT